MPKKESNVMKAKRILCKLSYIELLEIDKYVEARRKEVSKIEAEKKANEAWAEFLELGIRPGDLVWNSSSGISLFHTWQRSDCGAVWSIQPRLKKIWAETEYGWVVIRPYDLVTRVSFSIPTIEPISERERAIAESMGKALNESLSK